ncbi:hypothetical protein [Ferrovibrio sp.]|uniref:hypothetical protein n=1 Tax=Ferrovibrio sp. TaxID=1917215 RepID=UPI0035AE98D2
MQDAVFTLLYVRNPPAAAAFYAAILQPPTAMDFGYTFLAADPDGHRLRVFAPGVA